MVLEGARSFLEFRTGGFSCSTNGWQCVYHRDLGASNPESLSADRDDGQQGFGEGRRVLLFASLLAAPYMDNKPRAR